MDASSLVAHSGPSSARAAIAVAALAVVVLAIVLVARARAADRAAGPLRSRQPRPDGCAPPAGLRRLGRLHASGSAPTRRAATSSRRSSTACASRSRWASWPARSRSSSAPRSASCAAYVGGRIEALHHAHRRPAALLPGDPAGARARRRCSARARRSSSPRWSTAQYAYFARTAHGAASAERAQGLRRGGAVDAAAGAPHRVPPHPAELPAAADRGRDGAGRQRHRARGDAVVPRPRPAADRAFARHADRQRLPVHDVAAATGSRSIPASR